MNRIRIYNILDLKYRKRELRKKQTPAEKILWQILRRKILGYRFHRQYSAGPYVMDFYCPELKLGIELDGNVHRKDDNKKYDKYRTEWLSALGIKLLRFWNDEIDRGLDGVIIRIKSELPLGPPLQLKRGKLKRGDQKE